ncbi:SCY1-like protein 2 [Myotis davidii]|uniref:SCY1-like protein 2 n=1 Tax=Myotis davidii TaxID=225400 RepID=L5LJ28_MYODS|nr:SCY1-like protein 2 [Myotis davidii]
MATPMWTQDSRHKIAGRSLDIGNQRNISEEAKVTNVGSQIDKVFNNIGADLLTGGESENKEDVLQNKHKRASLTLEEKQKLAKEQEQAQKLKSQQPLKPQVHTPIAPVKQTKDLTDTLMDNMSSLTSLSVTATKSSASSTFTSVPSMGLGMMFSTPVDNTKRNLTNGLNANMGFQTSGFNMPVNTNQNFFSSPSTPGVTTMTMGTPSTLPNFNAVGVPPAGAKQTQQRPPDMSALNNLFGPQKPKVSMNQLSQQKPNQWLNQFAPPQGSPGMGSSVMGTQMNVMGQSAFGMQANPFFNPQNFAQPPTTMTSSSSASNDLKDLFGSPVAPAEELQLIASQSTRAAKVQLLPMGYFRGNVAIPRAAVLCGPFPLQVPSALAGCVPVRPTLAPSLGLERKGEGEMETSMMRIIDQLPPAHPMLGMEPETRACALTESNRDLLVHSWMLNH